MGSIKLGEWTKWDSEAASLVCYIRDFKNYDVVRAELGFMVEHISPDEFRTVINYIDGDSMAANTIYYSDTVHGYPETTRDFYESLWEDDIWQWNENLVIQNYFLSSEQEKIGFNGIEFHNVWTKPTSE